MNRKSFGSRGEDIAADYLKAKGFKIIKRNFSCKMGEIDIIAEKLGELYFVEVKTRKNRYFGDPLESVTLRKQGQIFKIASYFLMTQRESLPCHFSAIGIILSDEGEEINFIADAFMQ